MRKPLVKMAAQYHLVLLFCIFATVSVTVQQTESDKAELEKYIDEALKSVNTRYRLHYHLAPPVGWMNDPNGFSFYNNEYHLFYQFYPYETRWGPMHWGHSSSPDLVNWQRLPTALLPGEETCFSGSAEEDAGQLMLMYTAHKESDGVVNQTQYLAYSSDGINFDKYVGNPVLASSPNLSPDFRDPKIWKHEDHWYMVIGVKSENDRGQVLLYGSPDLKEWTYLSLIGEATHDDNMGFMWECPDFFELDGKFILLISPQGMDPVGDRYKNLFQTGYIIGSFSYETFQFVPEVEFQEIDFGYDYYAAQTMERNGARYIVGWMAMWESHYPEIDDGWIGALTIPRELKLQGNRILQKPVEAMKNLRIPETAFFGVVQPGQAFDFNDTAEIIFSVDVSRKLEILLDGQNGGQKTWIRWDPDNGKVVLGRETDDARQMEWDHSGSHTLRLFLDVSSVEMFCGDGEVVFSSRVYPDGPWRVTNLGPQALIVEGYQLKKSIIFDLESSGDDSSGDDSSGDDSSGDDSSGDDSSGDDSSGDDSSGDDSSGDDSSDEDSSGDDSSGSSKSTRSSQFLTIVIPIIALIKGIILKNIV